MVEPFIPRTYAASMLSTESLLVPRAREGPEAEPEVMERRWDMCRIWSVLAAKLEQACGGGVGAQCVCVFGGGLDAWSVVPLCVFSRSFHTKYKPPNKNGTRLTS